MDGLYFASNICLSKSTPPLCTLWLLLLNNFIFTRITKNLVICYKDWQLQTYLVLNIHKYLDYLSQQLSVLERLDRSALKILQTEANQSLSASENMQSDDMPQLATGRDALQAYATQCESMQRVLQLFAEDMQGSTLPSEGQEQLNEYFASLKLENPLQVEHERAYEGGRIDDAKILLSRRKERIETHRRAYPEGTTLKDSVSDRQMVTSFNTLLCSRFNDLVGKSVFDMGTAVCHVLPAIQTYGDIQDNLLMLSSSASRQVYDRVEDKQNYQSILRMAITNHAPHDETFANQLFLQHDFDTQQPNQLDHEKLISILIAHKILKEPCTVLAAKKQQETAVAEQKQQKRLNALQDLKSDNDILMQGLNAARTRHLQTIALYRQEMKSLDVLSRIVRLFSGKPQHVKNAHNHLRKLRKIEKQLTGLVTLNEKIVQAKKDMHLGNNREAIEHAREGIEQR